jgi:hypothetical protein
MRFLHYVILRALVKAEAPNQSTCMWKFYLVLNSKIITVISDVTCLCFTGRIISDDYVLQTLGCTGQNSVGSDV